MLLHEDNQAVVAILNAMVFASQPMMEELRKLAALLKGIGSQIEERWIPSAANLFVNSFSRTWDLEDGQLTA